MCPANAQALGQPPKSDINPFFITSQNFLQMKSNVLFKTCQGRYNYDVDWDNDGTYDQFGLTGNVTHNFGVAGTYTIRIRGAFPRIYFANGGDRQKLLDVGRRGLPPLLQHR